MIDNREASTGDIKSELDIGNVSWCAAELNSKLRANNDHRRVVHGVQAQLDQNHKTFSRRWMLVGGISNESNNPAN